MKKWLIVLGVLVFLIFSTPAKGNISGDYDEMIYYDYYVGRAGTAYPMGTKLSPIVNVTDLKTVALATNIRRIHVKGPLTLNASFDNFAFFGDSPQDAVVNLNNQSTNFSSFHNVVLTGNQLFASNDIYVHDSVLKQVTGLAATVYNSVLANVSLRGNPGDVSLFYNSMTTLQEIYGAVPNLYDVNVYGSHAVFRNWSGTLIIKNLNNSQAVVEIDGSNGSKIILDSSSTAGEIRVMGNLIVTDNTSGAIVKDSTNAARDRQGNKCCL